MPDNNIYVSGSYLVWGTKPYSTSGSGSARFLGGISSDFAGTPSGKIWISSANRHLYYSDSGSQVRIVPGTPLGITSTRPDGTIWIDQFGCPTASVDTNIQQLVWVYSGSTYGTTGENAYPAKGGRFYGSGSFAFDDAASGPFFSIFFPTGSGGQPPLSNGLRTSANGIFMFLYTSSNCGGTVSESRSWPSTLNFAADRTGSYYVTASMSKVTANGTALTYKIASSSNSLLMRSQADGATPQVVYTGSTTCLDGCNDQINFGYNWVFDNVCETFLT